MLDRNLRVTIAVGDELRRWELEAVRRIMAQDGVDVIGWVRLPGRAERNGTSWWNSAFHRVQRDAERHDVLAPVPKGLDDLGLPQLQGFESVIRDVTLLLGNAASLLDAPLGSEERFWAFHHADDASAHPVLPGLRESVLGMGTASFHLIDAVAHTALRQCCVPANGDAAELACTIVEHAAGWPAEALREWLITGQPPMGADLHGADRIATPGLLDMMRFRWRRFTGQNRRDAPMASGAWNIGVLHQPVQVLLQEDGSRNVRWLPSPSKGRARLEPFGYRDSDGELNVLFRKAEEDGSAPVIARVRPKPDNILKRSRIMLEEEGADGYPFTISIDAVTWMLMTNVNERVVRLHQVNAANDGFTQGPVLLREALHAPTLFLHAGRWWLFGTVDPQPDALLRAWHAERLEGPYLPHASATLKCDLRSSRPAGTPFMHDGQLYRPALDASDPQQPAVWINRVLHLDPNLFMEEPVRRIAGFPATAYGMGVRTISTMGDMTLVDGLLSPLLAGTRANARRGRQRSKHQDG
ncbi:MAG: hypothetical protein IPM46_12105 [Flavobacteriales bacterium]|nr:hypothetical protein [Flavobacteriales bacterium]